MRKHSSALFVLAFLVASVASASTPLGVDLALDPAKTLPALPVTFRITVSTDSAKPVAVPSRALLIVSPRVGETFLAGWEGDGARQPRRGRHFSVDRRCDRPEGKPGDDHDPGRLDPHVARLVRGLSVVPPRGLLPPHRSR